MINPLFSNDENSVWDPKIIKPLLCIPEDQLSILNNIPEWSKKNTTENLGRGNLVSFASSQLSDDSVVCTSAAVASHTSETSAPSTLHCSQIFKTSQDHASRSPKHLKQKKFAQNFDIFQKRIGYNKPLKKRRRSISFSFETSEFIKLFLKQNSLKRFVSTPDIFCNTVHLDLSYDSINKYKSEGKELTILSKNYSESSVTKCGEENIISYKLKENSNQFNFKGISASGSLFKAPNSIELLISKQTNTESPIKLTIDDMELATRIPENIVVLSDNLNNKLEFKISDKSTNGNNFIKDNIEASKNISISSFCVSNDSNKNINEKTGGEMESTSSENNVAESFSSKQVAGSIMNFKPNLKDNIDYQIVNESVSNSQDNSKVLSEKLQENAKSSEIHIVKNAAFETNGTEGKLSTSSDAKMHNEDNLCNQKDHANPPLAINITSVKRKSESKSKSSKKRKLMREKLGPKEAKINKASNICYNMEDVKNMINLMQQFYKI